MNSASLKSVLASDSPPVLIDVRLADDFESAHIPGAQNARVFEVKFLDQVAEIVTDKSSLVVLYGFGGESLEAAVAIEKLSAAGYSRLDGLDGGLEAWVAAGEKTEGTGVEHAVPVVPEGRLALDLTES